MKVKAINLFSGKNDLRKYLNVDMDDDEKEELFEDTGIDYHDIETVLKRATIFISLDRLPEEIEIDEVDE